MNTVKRLLLAALLIWVIAALGYALVLRPSTQAFGCVTDTECMKLCPANETDCDGGPQR